MSRKVKIQDASVIEIINNNDKLPIADTSGYPKSVTVGQIVDVIKEQIGSGGGGDLKDVYSKKEVDSKLNGKANKVHMHQEYITKIDSDNRYYTKNETYTQQEVKELIANSPTGDAYSKHDADEKFLSKEQADTDYQKKGNYATKDELGNKQETLVSGVNIKTINNKSIVGEGNLIISGGSGEGEPGATFIPHVSPVGELSWTNDKGLANPEPVIIKGKDGTDGTNGTNGKDGVDGVDGVDGKPGIDGTNGKNGYAFIPSLTDNGDLSWVKKEVGNEPIPATKNIKGPKGDAFTYSDFTEEQLKALKGKDGQPGQPGLPGTDGAPGQNGSDGKKGTTFTPNVTEDGTLSWTNDGGLSNPKSVNIKGPKGDNANLPIASKIRTGIVRIGEGVDVSPEGIISVKTSTSGGYSNVDIFGKDDDSNINSALSAYTHLRFSNKQYNLSVDHNIVNGIWDGSDSVITISNGASLRFSGDVHISDFKFKCNRDSTLFINNNTTPGHKIVFNRCEFEGVTYSEFTRAIGGPFNSDIVFNYCKFKDINIYQTTSTTKPESSYDRDIFYIVINRCEFLTDNCIVHLNKVERVRANVSECVFSNLMTFKLMAKTTPSGSEINSKWNYITFKNNIITKYNIEAEFFIFNLKEQNLFRRDYSGPGSMPNINRCIIYDWDFEIPKINTTNLICAHIKSISDSNALTNDINWKSISVTKGNNEKAGIRISPYIVQDGYSFISANNGTLPSSSNYCYFILKGGSSKDNTNTIDLVGSSNRFVSPPILDRPVIFLAKNPTKLPNHGYFKTYCLIGETIPTSQDVMWYPHWEDKFNPA